MEGFTVEQIKAGYELARIIAQNDRREAEAVDGYTEQLAAISRAREAFAGNTEILSYLTTLEDETREKIADELSHSDSLRIEYSGLMGIDPKED